jgi:hypothetical protein
MRLLLAWMSLRVGVDQVPRPLSVGLPPASNYCLATNEGFDQGVIFLANYLFGFFCRADLFTFYIYNIKGLSKLDSRK